MVKLGSFVTPSPRHSTRRHQPPLCVVDKFGKQFVHPLHMLGVRRSVPDSGTNDVRIQEPLTFAFSSKEFALVSTLRDAVCVFITAGPSTELCVWGEEDSGGHVL